MIWFQSMELIIPLMLNNLLGHHKIYIFGTDGTMDGSWVIQSSLQTPFALWVFPKYLSTESTHIVLWGEGGVSNNGHRAWLISLVWTLGEHSSTEQTNKQKDHFFRFEMPLKTNYLEHFKLISLAWTLEEHSCTEHTEQIYFFNLLILKWLYYSGQW